MRASNKVFRPRACRGGRSTSSRQASSAWLTAPSLSRGFAIILVLATLVLLTMLSLTYIKLALIDRNIARNYMDNKRAKLIAQSGIYSGINLPAKITLSSRTSIEPEKDVYSKINSLAQRLKLNDAQKDEFWAIMIDYYEVYQQVKDSSSQLQQLKDQTMQRLTQILSSHQMEDFKIDHLIGR